MSVETHLSERFQTPKKRRDFLGIASVCSAVATVAVGLLGVMRLPMPSVFPESNSRVKLGPLASFLQAEITAVPEHRLWIFRDPKGYYAVSAICTHLGCIVSKQETGGFFCPCHGSRFDPKGKVISGPAPKGLVYLELTVSPDGQLVVDKQQTIGSDRRLTV